MFASTMRLVATSSKLHIFSKDGDSEHMVRNSIVAIII